MPQVFVPGPLLPLHGSRPTRALEARAASQLPPHTLMQRAGLATARLALALAPHAQRIWIACGPGNNGGDGFEAAFQLKRMGQQPMLNWRGTPDALPADARASLQRALEVGVPLLDTPPVLGPQDLGIDALLGLGSHGAARGHLGDWLQALHASAAPVLAIDLPSGLDANTGCWQRPAAIALAAAPGRRHTLSLLSLKPGLFTAEGRDACGTLWFDDLGVDAGPEPACAWLNPAPTPEARAHASHKGNFGDVAVVGGQSTPGHNMSGAAWLAARAALHAGAGRVFVALLGTAAPQPDATQPELMLRQPATLTLPELTVVCGCGGGQAVAQWLPVVLQDSPRLVLDADALNAIAASVELQQQLRARQQTGQATVLTPHPLEAARLLGCHTDKVQADRCTAARQLAQDFGCVVVLKGSGSLIAAPGQPPRINPTGNARLASPGTGDVLAGLVGARLAAGRSAWLAACQAVFQHGLAAERWPATQPLSAGTLARQLFPMDTPD